MQSLVTFLALFAISITVGMIPLIGWIVSIRLTPVGVILWLILIYKAYQGEIFRILKIGVPRYDVKLKPCPYNVE